MYRKRWNIKKYFLTLLAMLFTYSLIVGYVDSMGTVKATTKGEELEESLVLVAEEVKPSVVSITTVKVFKHPTRRFHGDRRDKRDRRRSHSIFSAMIFLTDFFLNHLRVSLRHKAWVLV